MTLFSLAGSLDLANRTAQPESGSERKMNAIYGPKCLESFERFNHVGSWAKTFSALLIGTGDWYSRRCKLTWKLKGTKYNRLYFQLQASTLPTNGTEFGLLRTEMLPTPKAWDGGGGGARPVINGKTSFSSPGIKDLAVAGLLPTPTAIEVHNSEKVSKVKGKQETLKSRENGLNIQNSLMNFLDFNGMLPTPIASDIHHAERVQKLKESGAETMASRKNGASRPNGLMDYLDFSGMLPTPTAQIIKHSHKKEYWEKRMKDGRQEDLSMIIHGQCGINSQQLNPQFVLEMMGFKPDWTLLPFLSGETNQSRPPETPLCPK